MAVMCRPVQLKAHDLHAAGGCISTGPDMQTAVLKAAGVGGGGVFEGLQLPSLGRMAPTLLL